MNVFYKNILQARGHFLIFYFNYKIIYILDVDSNSLSLIQQPTNLQQLEASVLLIGNNLEFLDFCRDYIFNENKDFTVIGIIGSQSSGKSTLMSMLAKNDPADMYR